MHSHSLSNWEHNHTFGQDRIRTGERRTLIVVAITAVMMIVEIASGFLFGSMALLADGLHMGSHAAALGITAMAYVYARRYAADQRYSFGTGKVNALAGFTGAVLLALFAALMAGESISRFFNPVAIAFNQAILVAALGLVVNAASVVILGGHHNHGHEHSHDKRGDHEHTDHNLRAAYLHVLADALTSLLAVVALLAGKFFGAAWMDPLMGIVGAILVSRWSWSLLRDTSAILLDKQGSEGMQRQIRDAIEHDNGDRIADLHLWAIGPGIYAASLAIVSDRPESPDHYKRCIPNDLGIVHTTVEVHRCLH